MPTESPRRRLRRAALCLLAAFVASLTACSGSGDDAASSGADDGAARFAAERDRLYRSLVSHFLQPGYLEFKIGAIDLKGSTAAFCEDPLVGDLNVLRDHWRRTMVAWQTMSLVHFGPVEESNRRLRIQFFPDANDAVRNNVDRLLDDTAPVTEADIARSPVGAQGLPALEYLIFALRDFDLEPRRCEVAAAIARNLATMATQLDEAWSPGGPVSTAFVEGNGPFADRIEVLTELIASLSLEADFIADEKLTTPLAVGRAGAESFRSRHSLQNLKANAAALRAVLDGGQSGSAYGLGAYLRDAHGAGALVDALGQQLSLVEGALAKLDDTFENTVDGGDTGPLIEARLAMREVVDLTADLALAAGVNLGFNNRDGD